MNVKNMLLCLFMIGVTIVFGCEATANRFVSNEESNSQTSWKSDTRSATNWEGGKVDLPGISVRSENGDAVLFVECTLQSVMIDWPDALILGSGESLETRENFYADEVSMVNGDRSTEDWQGSFVSRKRVVRNQGFFSDSNQEFVRKISVNKRLKITQDNNSATWMLDGFKKALGQHCQ